jgi:glutathione S-transferase
MFGTIPGSMTRTAEIVNHCAMHLDDHEIDRLAGWIAWRLGRSQALLGDGTPIARLEHAVVHWLDEDQRRALVTWLDRRRREGLPPVPR